ncbi:MAG TPA: hypothetical protein VIV55_06755 [Flavobacterium sp.]
MKPKEVIDFLYENKVSLESLYHNNELDNKFLNKIGEYELVEEQNYNEEDEWYFQKFIIYFKKLGFYLEEKRSFDWGELDNIVFSIIEPIRNEIVFRKRKLILQRVL